MTSENLLALIVVALVTSISPGPSNLMLLTSGANFGFLRTLPQVFGITAGFSVLLLAVGLGVGAALSAWPSVALALKLLCSGYLLWLAWQLTRPRALSLSQGAAAQPVTFLQSACFQWVNPKAWAVATAVTALYSDPGAPVLSTFGIAATFAAVNVPSITAWVAFGVSLRRLLTDPVRLRWFNTAMAVLLAGTLFPILRG